MAPRHIGLAILITAIWGFSFIVIKFAVMDAPPLLLTALRFLFAAMPLVFFVKRPAVSWRILAAYGLCVGALQFGLLFTALKLGMPAGLVSLVVQVQVFFTIGLSALAGERPRPLQIAGAAIAFAGVGVIAAAQPAAALLPFAFVIAAAFAWATGNMASKAAGQVDMLGFVAWSSLFAPPPLLLLSFLTEREAALQALTHPSLIALGGSLFLAYVATVFGFGRWAWLLSRYRAAAVMPFALLVPVFGFLSSHAILGEPISHAVIVGGVLILAGLVANVASSRGRPPLQPSA